MYITIIIYIDEYYINVECNNLSASVPLKFKL